MANNTMTKLATTTVGAGGASSVTFSAIPQNYTDLVVKVSARTTNSANYDNALLSINSVATGYTTLRLYGNGTSAYSDSLSASTWYSGEVDGSTATSNTFGNLEIYLPNYTSSNFKSGAKDGVIENNATSATAGIHAFLVTNTSAITSLTFTASGNFVQYSEFTLYGVYAGGVTTPSAPTIASATDLGGGTAQIAISSPSAIPYTVTSSPSGITATGMSPIQISGLSPQTAYTFTAQAVAPFGVSAASAASSSVSMYNGMTALATQTLSSTTATVTFSSIPSGYSHLQLRCILRSTYSGVDAMRMRFNSDSGSNYAFHSLIGQGTAASAEGYASQPQIGYPQQANASLTASIFSSNVVDILDYSNTSKYKTARILGGFDANGSGYLALNSGLWQNTNAITDLTLFLINGSFAQYSTFVLYGVK